MDEQCGFVRLDFADGLGRHIGAIGLEHEPVGGDGQGGLSGFFGVFESDDAGEGDVETFVEEDFGLLG